MFNFQVLSRQNEETNIAFVNELKYFMKWKI